jgi:hypothetical protein
MPMDHQSLVARNLAAPPPLSTTKLNKRSRVETGGDRERGAPLAAAAAAAQLDT